jgi:hypothetical protein
VFDISDPVDPIEVGYYDDATVNAAYPVKHGKYIYEAFIDSGLKVIEFSGDTACCEESLTSSPQSTSTVVRGVLFQPGDGRPKTGDRTALLDAAGRRVMELQPGPNDVEHLSPGVYFISSPKSVEKVLLTR